MQIAMRTFRTNKAKTKAMFVSDLKRAMNEDVKEHYIKEHEKIVAGWKSDIPFKSLMKVTTDSISVYVFPTGKHKMKFIWVNEGTKPHKIEGKDSRLYIPIAPYVPYTQPIAKYGGYGGYPDGRSSQGFNTPFAVEHPGIKARKFTEKITKDEDTRRVFTNAIRRSIRRTLT